MKTESNRRAGAWSLAGLSVLLACGASCTGLIEDDANSHRSDRGGTRGTVTGTGGGDTSTGTTSTGSGGGSTGGVGTTGAGGATTGTGGAGGAGGGPTACTQGVPPTSQMPRLTRAQYDNTVRELFGIETQPSSMLAPDTFGSVDQRAWDGFQAAAESISTQVMGDAKMRSKAIPCSPTGDGVACATQFIQEFGRRAFRRPLTADEVTRFQNIYATRAQITAAGTFDQAAQVILKAFLVSPSFITRAELSEPAPDNNGYYVLSGYEVASRLSYMLWGSMPDEALFAAAAGGKLSNAAGIFAEAQRMLKDPKARAKVSEFHQQYAHMGEGTRWADITHDPNLFPAFTKEVAPLVSEETKRFFDYVVFDKVGSFQDLITSPVAFVNAKLAPLYGLDPAKFGADLVPTNLDPATRSGVFTRAGFLASYSLYDRASPILRGAFIQKEVLCNQVPPPPPGAEGTPLPTIGATNRERVDAQTAGADCRGCHHSIINPTGFAMEAYDASGVYQTKEKSNGAPIDTTADVIVGQTTVHVTGPVDLMNKIASSTQAQQCYAQKWIQAAYERQLTNQDGCTAQTLASKLAQNGYTVVDLVADLTQSLSFRNRAKE